MESVFSYYDGGYGPVIVDHYGEVTDDIHLYYWEKENLFADQYGQPFFGLINLITPQQIFMFRHDPYTYDKFQFRHDRRITVHIEIIPGEEICRINHPSAIAFLDLNNERELYKREEEYERQHMAVVGG